MRHRTLTILAVVAALGLAACGGDDADTAEGTATAGTATAAEDTPAETGTTAEEPATGSTDATATDTGTATGSAGDDEPTEEAVGSVTVAVASSDLGDILVDGDGRTLYVFDNDTEGQSACTGGCLDAWPPLAGTPTAGDGVDESLLSTITRDDGTTQATIGGSPLYYFASDTGPGDTNGQGVGDVWWVVDPSGARITE